MAQKICLNIHNIACTNTHHEVTDLVNNVMVKNAYTWISWERNGTFLRNKKKLNLCLRWHILGNHCFVAEHTIKKFQGKQHYSCITCNHKSKTVVKQMSYSIGYPTTFQMCSTIILSILVLMFIFIFYLKALCDNNILFFVRIIFESMYRLKIIKM